MNDEDCDDGDPDVHPGAAEDACDGVDRDCSGHWKTRVPTICPTIQAAVDVAPDGAEVCVEPGIYAEHVVLAGRDIVLLGLEGAGATTIDGSGTGRPLTITQGEGPKTRIEGFTLRGGAALEGAGLYMAGASPTLVELVFADNVASGDSAYGGGAFISESSSLLRDVAFRDNTAGYYGGGLYVSQSPGLRIERGDFRDNHALYGAGAAIYFSAAELENVVFAGNKGGMGGGLLVQGGVASLLQAAFVKNTSEYGGSLAATSGSTVTVRNAVFADNVATWSPDLGGAIQRCTTDEIEDGECDASVTVAFTDAWQNLPRNYGNMPDPGGQDGNVSVAPGFVDQGGVSPALWDLHLGPGSPLIDAGDPQRLDADASRSDIGAYGGPSA